MKSSWFQTVLMSALTSIVVLGVFAMQNDQAPPGSVDASMQSRVNYLEKKIFPQIEDSLTELQNEVASLGTMQSNVNKPAILSPTSQGYAAAQTESGIFLISIDRIDPYLDGFRVSLAIGNPMAVSYNGMTIDLEYGEKRGSTVKKRFELPVELRPGFWNHSDLILPGVTPKDIQYIEVWLTTKTVNMNLDK